MKSILLVSKEKDAFRTIKSCFHKGYRVKNAASREIALKLLQKKRYDLVYIDLEILLTTVKNENYKAALQPFWKVHPSIEIIVMTQPSNLRKAVMTVKAGARNYLTYPIDPEEIKHAAESVNETIIMESELDYLRDQFWQVDSWEIVQTKSVSMRNVFDKIRSVSPTKSTVLLLGETGTGKSTIAKLIHQHSNRRDSQFISVHCGAIPDTLLESELFGHEKGAFTGAVRRKLGKFEIAKGGTILLDEIATITPSAQIKLLQILQDGTFSRVGGEEVLTTDARIISATNADLAGMCDRGEFRKDLFYRLNVFPVEIPPLRKRVEDIDFLSEVFLNNLNQKHEKNIHTVHPQVIRAFKNYHWPGNIRELENLMERAYILETGTMLTPESFPAELFETGAEEVTAIMPVGAQLPLSEARRQAIDDFERQYLKQLFARNKGKVSRTAEEAGVSTRQLNKLMVKYGIRKEAFKD